MKLYNYRKKKMKDLQRKMNSKNILIKNLLIETKNSLPIKTYQKEE